MYAGLLMKQATEKRIYDDQLKEAQQTRKQRYKMELERDMLIKEKRLRMRKEQENSLDSLTLQTLAQREQKSIQQQEQRRLLQLEASLENLNQELIRKKFEKERQYQRVQQEQEVHLKDRISEIKSLEKHKMIKQQEQQQLREQYESMIKDRRMPNKEKQYLPMDQITNERKQIDIQYIQSLNQQLEEKRQKMDQLNQRKVDERQQIERKIQYEREKLLQNKQEKYQMHKEYEAENLKILQEPKSIKPLWNENQNPKLPPIYSDNYKQRERDVQLKVLDRDLQKYQSLQDMHLREPVKRETPQVKTPMSRSSKQTSYAQIHKTPIYKGYNIVTGQMH